MKTMTKIILTVFVMSLYNVAIAATQTLTTISVSEEKYTMQLELVVDNKSDIKQFKLIEIVKGKTVEETIYDTDGAKEGIILMEQSGREVVKLVSENFSPYNGGNVVLDYLYDGITGKRKSLEMDLSRDGDEWSLYINGRKSTTMHFVKNKKALVGVVGIKDIEVK